MTTFFANQPVDMQVLPEMALLLSADPTVDFGDNQSNSVTSVPSRL